MKMILIIIVMGITSIGYGQEDKITPRIDITYYQIANDLPYVNVRVRKRVDRRFLPITNVPVNLFFNEESEETKMGSIVTNDKGEGKLILPESLRESWNDLQEFEFIAVLLPSDSIEDMSESMFIKRARLLVETEDTDEGRIIRVTVQEKSEDDWNAIADTEVKIFVKRHFGRLVVGDDYYTTDENGVVETLHEEDFPGDEEGMITLGGIVEDHEEYGNVIAYLPVKWGIPIKDEPFRKRSLWASRANTPWWLLIFPNLVILGVWGVIGYLVLMILKIKKLGKV